jgi:Glycosyltransferases involved in cell wall biogenesis
MEISIITPVYNGERFIRSCIQSVANQDRGNCEIEHLIIDGGSTDQTVEIVKDYADKYPHIRWLSEKDEGQSDAMNKGFKMARGRILGFLNADDFYESGALARVCEMFKTLPEPSLLVGNCKVIDDVGKLLWLNKPNTKYYQLLQVWRFVMPNNASCYFYHRSLHDRIGEYDTQEHFVMDLDFLLHAVRAAHVAYLDETFGNYRVYPGTKTSVNAATGSQLDMICRVSRRHARRSGLLYRFHVALGIALFRQSWRAVQKPSFFFRVKWRLMRDCQKLLDRFAETRE